MSSVEELENFEPQHYTKKTYSDNVMYQGCEISPMNHPTALANHILNTVQHTITYGANFIAPMGYSKTTAATVLAHHIHMKRPEFKITWGDDKDFIDLKGFFERQPKCQPSVFIFDDITGALKQMGEKEMQANFNILTKIRWQIDPEKGKTPIITFTTSHYSKNMEKEFRAVLGISCFNGFGAEERTNIDTIAPKNTLARFQLEKFARISEKMFSTHEFFLKTAKGKWTRFETDNPLRPYCAITGNGGYIIVSDEKDCCNVCAKKKSNSWVAPEIIYDQIKSAYQIAGIQALKLALWRRGYYLALGKKVAPASDYIEKKVFPGVTTDFDKLVELIYKNAGKKAPERYHRRLKAEKESMRVINDNVIKIELDDLLSEDEDAV